MGGPRIESRQTRRLPCTLAFDSRPSERTHDLPSNGSPHNRTSVLMKKTHTAPPSTGVPERASAEATAAYASRFGAAFEPGFFRPSTLGLTLSSIGAGTYLGGCYDEDDQAYTATLTDAFARGINFVDTAPNYRAQRAERTVGAALRHAIEKGTIGRADVVISTKGGYVPLNGEIPATREEYEKYLQRVFVGPGVVQADDIVRGHSLAPRFLRYSIALSRQNMGIRTIDLYLLHNPEHQLQSMTAEALRPRLRAAFAVLEEAAARGEIGCYGCASWNAFRTTPGSPDFLSLSWLLDIAKEVAGESHRFRAVQLPVNLAMAEGIRETNQRVRGGHPVTPIRAATELGLAVIASAPLMQGRLASGLPESVRELFPNHRTDAQRAISFVKSLPGITTTLVGMRDAAHLTENLEAFGRADSTPAGSGL